MALIYDAQLSPTKAEMLAGWVPAQPWARGARADGLVLIDAYRFDDPDDLVGVETHLLRTAVGRILQVPVTYRGAPLPGADDGLITTMEHSVLGPRWVYDAVHDPVYAQLLAATIVTGGHEAALQFVPEPVGGPPPVRTRVRGSGGADAPVPEVAQVQVTEQGTLTTVHAGPVRLEVLREPTPEAPGGAQTLTGTWPGQQEPAVLARLLS